MTWPLNQLAPWPPDPGKVLVVCQANDWWGFVYHITDDACPAHGWRNSRTPQSSALVEGPCRGCGATTSITYTPGSHSSADLLCGPCSPGR